MNAVNALASIFAFLGLIIGSWAAVGIVALPVLSISGINFGYPGSYYVQGVLILALLCGGLSFLWLVHCANKP